MKPYRILFMGTAPIAVPTLTCLIDLPGIELVGVVSQPPRRRGRGRKEQLSPVHQAAQKYGFEVVCPQRFAGTEGDAILHRLNPDACLVMAYGQIIKQNHLDHCPNAWLNLHASLLPRWRGAAPIERCLEAGDQETGVQLMGMQASLDTGPIYAESRLATLDHNAGSLTEALGTLAAHLTRDHLLATLQGQRKPNEQDPSQACYAQRIQRSEGQIDFRGDALAWVRKARAFNPRLGLRCRLLGPDSEQSLKIWGASIVDQAQGGQAGTILRCDKNALWISCEQGVMEIEVLQVDGKKRLKWSEFYRGNPLGEGWSFRG